MRKQVTKSELYKTRGLISIASLLGVSEQTVNRIHDAFLRGLEGTRFSHKRFM